MSEILWKEVEKLAVHNVSALVVNCENVFDAQIYAVADELLNQKKVSLVLIAGPSASGKTTSANLLGERLQNFGVKVHRLSTDDYFLDKDTIPLLPGGLRDFDNIRSINIPLLQQHISQLLNYNTVVAPRFDFFEGKGYPDGEVVQMEKTDIVILEGIHALNPVLTSWCDDVTERIKKISIAPRRSFRMESGQLLQPDEIRLLRRLIRDFYTRGYTFEDTVKQWAEVRNAEIKYIQPYVGDADYKIDSVYDYELIVYKQCIFNKIKDTHITELQGIRKALAEVNSMIIDTIPSGSLLNEFVHYGEDAKEEK